VGLGRRAAVIDRRRMDVTGGMTTMRMKMRLLLLLLLLGRRRRRTVRQPDGRTDRPTDGIR